MKLQGQRLQDEIGQRKVGRDQRKERNEEVTYVHVLQQI